MGGTDAGTSGLPASSSSGGAPRKGKDKGGKGSGRKTRFDKPPDMDTAVKAAAKAARALQRGDKTGGSGKMHSVPGHQTLSADHQMFPVFVKESSRDVAVNKFFVVLTKLLKKEGGTELQSSFGQHPKLRVILVVAQALCVLTVFVFAAVIAAVVAGLVALYVVLLARLLIEFSGHWHVLLILKLVEFLANMRAV